LLAVAEAQTRAHGNSPAALAHGYRVAMGVAAALAVAALVVAAALVRERVCREHRDHLRRRSVCDPWPLPEVLASGHARQSPGGLVERPTAGVDA
jgi:hypothetical protein